MKAIIYTQYGSIDRVYRFDKIVEAHHNVEQGHKRGNVAITLGLSFETYIKSRHADLVRALFGAVYPEWNATMLDRMVYDERHPSHLQTRLAYENELVIGQANAFWIDRDKRIANLGYHIHPRYQRKGLGYRLTKALIEELSDQVNYFVVLTTDDNLASQKLCEKLGFTHPSEEIQEVIVQTAKYKKIPEPYLKVLAVDHLS